MTARPIKPAHSLTDPDTRIYVGDCREVLPAIPEVAAGEVDLIFADPPFNWNRAYDEWDDRMKREDYLDFTAQWLDACVTALKPSGAFWVNIPDDTAAEIVVHLKQRGLHMVNWCIWHYRFGQNRLGAFINSKVHALYFVKEPKEERTWNADPILEPSDRATTYFDPRTHNKKEGTNGLRVPMDVWYGKFWGRIQGNNKERRHAHDNQIPEVYLERVIRACSNEGDLVLDPFLGSGTTGLIARELGRRSIGVEFSKANAKSCYERIKAGPVRVRKDEPTQQSTAIFAPRRRGADAGVRLHKAEHAQAPHKE
jgi:site-specific DNA-methyltransferase (adenine-specific)